MYSTKSPLISYSFSNTLVQNLITFQHIHMILKSTCSQRELPCMITTASTERNTQPSAHDATDILQHCHKENYVHSLCWNVAELLLLTQLNPCNPKPMNSKYWYLKVQLVHCKQAAHLQHHSMLYLRYSRSKVTLQLMALYGCCFVVVDSVYVTNLLRSACCIL